MGGGRRQAGFRDLGVPALPERWRRILANPVLAPILAGVEAAPAERRFAALVAHPLNDAKSWG